MDARKGRMERAAEYATKQSVFNEGLHAIGVAAELPKLASEVQAGSFDNPTLTKVWFAVNLGAMVVQRYNRVRIVQFLDNRLEHGKRFEEAYTNWLHLDNRSIDHPAALEDEPGTVGNGNAVSLKPTQEEGDSSSLNTLG